MRSLTSADDPKEKSAVPEEVGHRSLTTLREKLIKIGAKMVRHGRYVTFKMAEVAVSGRMFGQILARIARLRALPVPAWTAFSCSRLIDGGLECVSLEEAIAEPAYYKMVSVVSDKYLVYQQKLADTAGRPIPAVVPSFQTTLDKVVEMGEDLPL